MILLQFQYYPGNNRSVHFQLEFEDGSKSTGSLIQSQARLIALLAHAREVDDHLVEEKRGWRSYDELIKRVEIYTDWAIERTALVQMASKIGRVIRNAVGDHDHTLPNLIERFDGAARIALPFQVDVESPLDQILAPEIVDARVVEAHFPPVVHEILNRYQVDPVDRLMLRNAIIDAISQQLEHKNGPWFDLSRFYVYRGVEVETPLES